MSDRSASHRPLLGAAAVIVVAAALSVGVGTERLAGASASVVAEVPVVQCPTSRGADFGPPVRLATTIAVRISATLATSVALYVDRYDVARMVGPRGWSCAASIGADGNEGLVIYQHGSPAPAPFQALSGRSSATELTVQQDPACDACRLSLVCPFFATARRLITSTYASASMLAACRRPSGEVITSSTASTRYFSDGPHVVGHAYPSGGPYRAFAVAYFGSKTYSYLVSCTLAPPQRALCHGALAWFVSHHRAI